MARRSDDGPKWQYLTGLFEPKNSRSKVHMYAGKCDAKRMIQAIEDAEADSEEKNRVKIIIMEGNNVPYCCWVVPWVDDGYEKGDRRGEGRRDRDDRDDGRQERRSRRDDDRDDDRRERRSKREDDDDRKERRGKRYEKEPEPEDSGDDQAHPWSKRKEGKEKPDS